jgi:hypothetical protein
LLFGPLVAPDQRRAAQLLRLIKQHRAMHLPENPTQAIFIGTRAGLL